MEDNVQITVEEAMENLFQQLESMETFVFGLSYGELPASFRTRNYFEVVQDNYSKFYFYTILDDSKLEEIYEKFSEYLDDNNIPKQHIALDDVYDTNSLSSALSLGELFGKLELVYRRFSK